MAKKGFNLLRPQVEPPTVWTKLYDYVVGSARVIVILVELIVVVAFVIRIVVDVQSKNLNEEIKTKESIIKSFQAAELRYTQIQRKTSAYNAIWTNSPQFSLLFAEINSYIPTTAREVTVLIDTNSISINGVATIGDIGEFERDFKNSPTFVRKKVDQVEREGISQDVMGNFSFLAFIKELNMKEIIDSEVEIPAFPILDQPTPDGQEGTVNESFPDSQQN